jgi:phosphonoacetaldehyde hydrolase
MKKIKAVIFDWAGTLVDFGSIAPVQVFVEVFAAHGVAVTTQEVRSHMGLAKKDHLHALLQMDRIATAWREVHGTAAEVHYVDIMYEELTPKLTELVSKFAAPIDGIPELLLALRAEGIKIGSTTGYVEEMMAEILPIAEAQGIKIDAVVNSSECLEGRPSPFMIFRNMEKLGLYHADEIIKVGDTVADMHEGVNAGTWTVGITTSGNEIGLSKEAWDVLSKETQDKLKNQAADRLIDSGAHFVIHDLRNLPSIIEEINAILEYPEN